MFQHLRRLDHILKLTDLHVYGLAVFFFLIACFQPFFYIVLVVYLYKTKRFYNKILLALILLSLSILFIYTKCHQIKKINGLVRVVSAEKVNNNYLYTVRYKLKKYQFYSIDRYSENEQLSIKATVEQFSKQRIPFGFDEYKYYLGNNIRGRLKLVSIEKTREASIIYLPKQLLKEKAATLKSSLYINAFIFNEIAFEKEDIAVLRDLNILFLLSLSGLHLYQLFLLISKIMFYLNLSPLTQKAIKVMIYLVFFYLQGFNFVLLRLSLKNGLSYYNKQKNWQYNSLDILFLTFFIVMLLQFHLIFNQGFLITFLILICLNLSSQNLAKLHPLIRAYSVSSIVFLVIFPFYAKVSIIQLLMMPIFIFIFTIVIFLIGIMVLFIPVLDNYYMSLLSHIESLIIFVNNINKNIYFAKMTPYVIIVFYSFVVFFFLGKTIRIRLKRLIAIAILIFINQRYVLDYNDVTITFLDVKQGDATIIRQRDCVVVIDAFDYVTNYLRNHGISKIDYLVLTHKDLDHTKEAEALINNFEIKTIIVNPYDDYNLSHNNVISLKQGDSFKCNSQIYFVLSPSKHYFDSNNHSLVIKSTFYGKTFLFTGDIDSTVEQELITKKNIFLKADVLKLAHHGSQTSSSMQFLEIVKPSVAIVSSGFNNQYSFPHQSVLKRLAYLDIKIYRTDLQGTIIYQRRNKREKWQFMLPI